MPFAKRIESPSQSCYWNSHFTAAPWALEDGIDSGALTERLAKVYGREHASRIVGTACVRLRLAEGMPAGDAITMLERRRVELSSGDCRAYSIEIFLDVRRAMLAKHGTLIPSQKAMRHAAA